MMDIIKNILGVDFQRLCLLLGCFFFFMSATGGALTGRRISIPRLDKVGRLLFGVVGSLMILVPLLHYATGTVIGLIRFEAPSPVFKRNSPGSLLSIGTAAAADSSENQSLRIDQRHAASFRKLSGRIELAAYVGDVHVNKPNEILLFRNNREYDDFVDRNVQVWPRDIRRYIRPGDIIFDGFMQNSDATSIKIEDFEIQLHLQQVLWFAFGTDSVILEVEIR